MGAGLLVLAAVAPALPPPASILLLALCLLGWAFLGPPVRDLLVVGLGGAFALTILFAGWRGAGGSDLEDRDWQSATRRNYAAAWTALDAEASGAAAALEARGLAQEVRSEEERLAAVRVLAELAEASGRDGTSGRSALMLVDPDGEPVAWAGEGLLHELQPEEIPSSGRTFEASFGAVTLLAVQPLDQGRRPWRAVAARSHPTDRLPFSQKLPLPARSDEERGAGLRWSLVWLPGQAAPGAAVLAPVAAQVRQPASPASATPLLVVERGPAPRAPGAHREWAWGSLGLALFLLAAMWGTGLALAVPTPPGPGAPRPLAPEPEGERQGTGAPPFAAPPAFPGGATEDPVHRAARSSTVRAMTAITLVAVVGALSLARAVGAESDSLLALAAGLALAVAGVGLGPGLARAGDTRGKLFTALAGAGAVGVLAALAWTLQPESAAFEPAAQRGSSATLYILRVALAAGAMGLLTLAGGRLRPPREPAQAPSRQPSSEKRGEVWVWSALAPLLAGGAVVDLPWLALPLFAAVGAALALWLGQRRRSPAVLVVLAVLAAVLAAGIWETAHRELLRDHLVHRVLPRLGVPEPEERAALVRRVNGFFAGTDLARFVPRSPAGLGREDLAFLLWQASPLARPHVLSRVIVEPSQSAAPGEASAFSFGIPAGEPGLVESGPPLWRGRVAGPARERLVEGTSTLSHRGQPWAMVRWSMLPLPGFRLGSGAELENVEAALLRGLPGGVAETGLPGGAVFVAYDAGRRAFASPWREQTRLPIPLAGAAPVQARVPTPTGPAWAAARPVAAGDGGWEVLYLPWLTPRASLERVGTRTLEVLLAVLAATLVALLVALPRAGFRVQLQRTVRSYSRRLLLVYTVLLLVPLLLLNVVLVAAMENRLRQEQRAAGEAALASAQKVVGDYLASVEPGFDLANVLDDELLLWISEVLRHEINLYWGSEVWASSKPELFTARLLPKRIPGESFAGIAFLGYDLAARTNRVGEVSYLELYAPLRVAGDEAEPANFFLSMPLLAQQEEVARELAALRRQALLVTAVLILVVTGVGVRLSRSFTRPLTELVEGTRRIAAGATSLDLSPSEFELAALVEAVDEMARRIAVGRERLVREKQVVERMVEHITSGIVSLDHHRRVLMRNRVAAELLGVEVGERLDEALARRERLAGLVPWLAAADRHLAQRTVRLLPPEEEESGASGPGAQEAGEVGAEREWTLVWVPVPGPGEPAALLVVEDVTETLRSQRLEAWAEMARIIAHEIKNPLTPIRLNIEHLQQVWSDQPGREALDPRFGQVLERCATNVLQQVDELRQIASEFSTYSHIPKIDPRRGDLVEAMEELVEPYRTAPPPGVEVLLESEEEAIHARFDRRLLVRAVRNLVENALRASTGGGRVVLRLERHSVQRPTLGPGGTAQKGGTLEEAPPEGPTPSGKKGGTPGKPGAREVEPGPAAETAVKKGGTAEASAEASGLTGDGTGREKGGTFGGRGVEEGPVLLPAEARISVLDTGPGIAPNLLQRIFDPYFSTFDTGTGLGLPIARRIAEEHGGSIAARNRPGGGLEVSITLPAE